MMKYLYIEKRQRAKKDNCELSQRASRIKEEFEKLNIDHDIFHLDEVAILISSSGLSISLPQGKTFFEYTHIIFGGHSLGTNEYEIKKTIIKLIEKWNQDHPNNQIKVQNKKMIDLMPFYSKIDVANLCINNNLPHLSTYYSTAGDYKANLGPLTYPIVVKHINGVNDLVLIDGKEKIKKNVFLVKNENDWEQERLKDKNLADYFIQEYSPVGEDYRIFLTKEKIVGGWKRVSPKDNFMTVTKGSEYYYYNEPNNEITDLCNKARSVWPFDFMALDLIYKDDKPYVLEFSLHPGFHAYETKCSNGEPVNVAKAIIEAF